MGEFTDGELVAMVWLHFAILVVPGMAVCARWLRPGREVLRPVHHHRKMRARALRPARAA